MVSKGYAVCLREVKRFKQQLKVLNGNEYSNIEEKVQ